MTRPWRLRFPWNPDVYISQSISVLSKTNDVIANLTYSYKSTLSITISLKLSGITKRLISSGF